MITQDLLKSLLTYSPETGVFLWVSGHPRLNGKKAGSVCNGYKRIAIARRSYLAHRLAWMYMTGNWPASQVDHINGDRSDNRWSNLRAAESSQNSMNRAVRRNCASGIKGLSRLPSGSWLGAIYKQGKCWKKESKDRDLVIQWLGQTRKSLHGEFASDGAR